MPVVIYLHGNASSRLEGLSETLFLLEKGINVFAFDFSGSGLSDGEYISLGFHEKDDLKDVIDYIMENLPGVSKIGLWGRSMGASTALLYMKNDNRVNAACFDSPFADFSKLAHDIAMKVINLGETLLKIALQIINKSIKDKTGADIFELIPIKYAPEIKQAGLFIHGKQDEIVPYNHGEQLYEAYGGECRRFKL